MELPIVVAVFALILNWIPCILTEEDHNAPYADSMQGSHSNEVSLANSESQSKKSGRYSVRENTKNDDYKNRRNSNVNSPWCAVAGKCDIDHDVPVCGFDDNFGLAKFDGICHLFEVNCYWNYNFSVAPCRSMKN